MRFPFVLLFAPVALWAQQYVISTIAGGGPVTTARAIDTSINPRALATDAAGSVYLSDALSSRIFRLSPDGLLTPVAGNRNRGYSGDAGPATSAQLNNPWGVAVDHGGNLYIGDDSNNRVRKVSRDGIITTVAGNGTHGYSGDGGPATSAQLYGPMSTAVDTADNIYIADTANSRIRKVTSSGIISTIAGTGDYGYSGDGGPATNAKFSFPVGIVLDGAGNLYVADGCAITICNFRIRKISANGIITTVAGNGTGGNSGDGGPAIDAQLGDLEGVAVDGAGNLYIADTQNQRIRKVSLDGIITTIAGNGTEGYSGDGGQAVRAQLSTPTGVAVDGVGNLYIADPGNFRVRKVSPDGIITTVAGNGTAGDDGPATSAGFDGPRGVALDGAGNAYIADSFNSRVRKISANGTISTIAGNGTAGYSGDGGPATAAQLRLPSGVTVDGNGNVYIADTENNCIRRVSPSGIISTIAGTGTYGYSGDGGPAVSAQLSEPEGMATDTSGNLYIGDFSNHRIRKVSPAGVITTIAGNGTAGDSGDGGPATSAQLQQPSLLTVDAEGNLYIADDYARVRKVSPAGIINTVAGNGTPGFSGDGGPATSAQLNNPWGVALDRAGNLYISESTRIRKVSTAGIISTIAGTGISGYSGDGGPATSAQLSFPFGIAVDSGGNVYIADYSSGVVRLLEPDGPAPTITTVTNAASNLVGPIAPGEIVVLYHSGIGPAQLTQLQLNQAGLVGTQLDRTQVSFNGIPAPLVYTWISSLAAVVPYSVSGTSAQAQLTFRDQTSEPFVIPVTSSSPGLFTLDSTGRGQAAAVNSDGGYNSAQNPANIGAGIVLFGTGEGQTSPAGVDGKLGSDPPPKPALLPVTVTIGGQIAHVTEVGGVPGMVAGVMRIEATIPSGITSGDAVPVIIQVSNGSSQSGVTIAVAGK